MLNFSNLVVWKIDHRAYIKSGKCISNWLKIHQTPNWTFFTEMKHFYYTPPFLIYRAPVLFCSSSRINFVNSPKLQFRGLSSLYISWDFSRASSCSIWFYCRTLQEKKCRFSPLFGGKNVLEGAKNDNRIFFFLWKSHFI